MSQGSSARATIVTPQRASAVIPPRQPVAPRIRPVPDLEAERHDNRAPSLLDPRDRTASAPLHRKVAFVPAVWAKTNAATQASAQVELTPPLPTARPQIQRVSTAKPAVAPADDELWDDSGWKSVRP